MYRKLLPVIATAFALTAGASTAATLQVTSLNNDIFKDENGNNAWRVVSSFSVGTQTSGPIYAGAFRLQGENDAGAIKQFLAFCLEPLENMTVPKAYAMGSLFTDTVNTNLQTLAKNAWGKVNDSVSAAAFQMAAWEITTEMQATFDINDGDFKITSNRARSNDAEDLAQTWLNKIQSNAWSAPSSEFMMLNATGTQDLLTNVQAVPVPASGLLLIGGLAGAGAVARRKQKAK